MSQGRPARDDRCGDRSEGTFGWAGRGCGTRSELPFEVDEQTTARLGPGGLAELAANLWPVDCQSCGHTLAGDRPALYVADLGAAAFASLHHVRCRGPEWAAAAPVAGVAGGRHLTWTAQSFLLPTVIGDRRNDRPVILVNPGLEQVILHLCSGGWQVGTVELYRRWGLRTPGRDFVADRPVPDVTAELRNDVIAAGFHARSETWSCTATAAVCERIHALHGVTLGIASALDPGRLTRLDEMLPLIEAGTLALGWVPLTEARPPG